MAILSTQTIKERLVPLLQKSSAKKVILFGSYASGKATRRSDLDLMIIADTEKRFFNRHDDFLEIYAAFKGCGVDLLIYTPEEFSAIAHRRFIQDILQQGEVLYEC